MTTDEFAAQVPALRARVVAMATAYNHHNTNDQEDIAQDALTHAWLHLHQYEGRNGASFYTWFYRLSVNILHDRRRRAMREPLREALPLTESSAWYMPDVNAGFMREDMREFMHKLRLTVKQRKTLAKIEDGTYVNPVKADKSHRHRILLLAKAALAAR